MSVNLLFPKQVLLATVITALLAAYPLSVYGSDEIVSGIVAGGLLSLMNVLVAYFSILYAFEKPNPTFVKVILGGMILRMAIIGAVVIVLLKWFQFHLPSLIGSLFFYYFLFMVFEIIFINKKLKLKKNL